MEFVQMMKDWRRMCKAQDDTTCGACSSCPMGDYGKNCTAVYEDEFDTVDIAHIEQTVTAWAAENPEPQYPTWWTWLINEGVIEKGSTYTGAFDQLKMKSIPSDIAEKLGIAPKEG